MQQGYRKLLDDNLVHFCESMNPTKVVSRLVTRGILKKYDAETINHEVTTQNKNAKIIDTLQNRDFNSLSEFLRTLTSIDHNHSELAEKLQPVQHRITWFAPSPTQAAAVVYVLETYADAKFSRMERTGERKSLVVRRARIFPKEFTKEDYESHTGLPIDVDEVVRLSHKIEVCLVFPASHTASDTLFALESCFAGEELVSCADMLLMSGAYESHVGERRRAMIATEVCGMDKGESVCAGMMEDELHSLKTTLLQTLTKISDEKGGWIRKEGHYADDKPELVFRRQQQLSTVNSDTTTPNLDIAEDATGATVFTSDPQAFRFYSLCEDKCPGKQSLMCYGVFCHEDSDKMGAVSPGATLEGCVVGPGAESTAAVTSSCILMEVCRECFDKQPDADLED